MNREDYVLKRNGEKEIISFDKILRRVKKLSQDKNLGNTELNVKYTMLAQKIIDRLYNEIKTREIDELTAQQCASLSTVEPDYGVLASRIMISNHHKNTDDDYSKVVEMLYNYKDIHDNHSPIVSERFNYIVQENKKELNEMIDYNRDYLIDYFGFKTLERAYLMRINGVIVERPQHMWMRVAIAIHGNNMEKVRKTYDLMSQKYFTHATPTLFNSGTSRQQMSSCYLIAMEEDSINGIYSTLADCASISKWAGGIGLHIHNVRASGSHIRGTNGTSNGIVPMLRVFNNTARYCDQGGGKRKGSFAIYLEPWHADIEDFLEMKKNHGDEERRARDLFYALWIPDLFMKRVKGNGQWTLMCPDKCPGLSDVYGDEFEKLYTKYENEGRGSKTMNARDVWFKILDSQIETGTPYMLYKDACNIKSNQKNLGTIKSSNLCCEIVEYSDDKETAVCNLASIALSKFVTETPSPFTKKVRLYSKNDCKWCDLLKVLLKRKKVVYEEVKVSVEDFDNFKKEHGVETLPQLYDGDELIGGYTDSLNVLRNKFDYDKLLEITKVVTENLNNVIDINFYPTEKTKASNLRHRPIGIGVQGLADAFAMMDVPYHSEEAKQINKNIFETIYYGALKASNELAQGHGCYESFTKNGGCPASKGILQFDLWGVTPSERYEWDVLKLDIKKHGLRNSLLVAPMPTASTSQILGNNECFEPFTSNIYLRRTLAGEFTMINKFLIKELIELGLWSEDLKNRIIQDSGSVQKIKEIPQQLKMKYKTVWEIPMKHVLEMCADRGAYICQSQSTNLWMKDPSYDKLTAMHFFAWSRGLKTGIYYLRTKAKAAPQQFTIEPDKKNVVQEEEEDCLMCGS